MVGLSPLPIHLSSIQIDTSLQKVLLTYLHVLSAANQGTQRLNHTLKMPPATAETLLVFRILIVARTYFPVTIKKPKCQRPVKGDPASEAGTGHILAESF